MSNNNSLQEHMWKYFEIHAQQRISIFNFYLAITGLIATGMGICLQQGGKITYMIPLLGLFLILSSFIFWKLDQRTSFLVKQAESAMIEFEKNLPLEQYKLFTKDKNDNSLSKGINSIWSYGKSFRYTFLLIGLSGYIMCFMSIFLIKN